MQKNVSYIVFLALLLATAAFFLYGWSKTASSPAQNTSIASKSAYGNSFLLPKKIAHFQSSTPSHGWVLSWRPYNVVIDFDQELKDGSTMSILLDGKEYGTGEFGIDSNKKTMRRKLEPAVTNGVYTVYYAACWKDEKCDEGNFQFAVDITTIDSFIDLRSDANKDAVIHIVDGAFRPQEAKVKVGQKVTWVNDDSVEHSVNTDSYPSNTFYPLQNSKKLKKGEQFSTIFALPGAFPYHSDSNPHSMTGVIVAN